MMYLSGSPQVKIKIPRKSQGQRMMKKLNQFFVVRNEGGKRRKNPSSQSFVGQRDTAVKRRTRKAYRRNVGDQNEVAKRETALISTIYILTTQGDIGTDRSATTRRAIEPKWGMKPI